MNRFVVAEPLWCTGCNTCLAACSDVHKTQGLQQHPRLALAKTSTITAPVVCHHCEEAPCLQVCPVNAISQRDDAIQLNESLCIGCKLCAVVCPFGAISASGSRPVNAHAQYVFQAEGSLKNGEENVLPQHALLRWEPGVQTVAVKCDLCDFLPEGPACVRACPNQALRLITDDSLQRQMKEKQRLAASWFANGGEDPISANLRVVVLRLILFNVPMNYSHDNWSAILAHIGKPEELDTSARNAGALTRRREIRDAATLLRLGLAYGPGGMSLREVTAWAQLHDVATLSDVALLKRLRNAADWFGILAAQTLAVRAAVTGCTSGKRLRLVDGTAISAPGGGSAEWRLHMGYDPHTCQFTDFELTDSRDAERLDRFAQTADEIRIADRGFGSRPECIRSLAFGEADYIVRVHWRGLRWLTAEGMRFDMMGFLRGLDCGKNGETTVMIGNSGNKKAGAPFPARLIAVSLPPEKALISKTRLLSENRRKGRVVQAETLEAAGHVLLLTSLPEDEYSAEQVADCYRLRWQIELAFKRLKSLLHLDALRAKEPELAKAWIFANLLAAFLIDDIIQPSLDFPPRSAGSEKKN
ncbi:IS186, transposase [Escherichia coli]|nr:IS186, transposase [Escherichia coli]